MIYPEKQVWPLGMLIQPIHPLHQNGFIPLFKFITHKTAVCHLNPFRHCCIRFIIHKLIPKLILAESTGLTAILSGTLNKTNNPNFVTKSEQNNPNSVT